MSTGGNNGRIIVKSHHAKRLNRMLLHGSFVLLSAVLSSMIYKIHMFSSLGLEYKKMDREKKRNNLKIVLGMLMRLFLRFLLHCNSHDKSLLHFIDRMYQTAECT